MKIRVLIVDDSAMMRRLLTQIIEQSPDFEVVGAAPDAQSARELIKELNPDVLTLDVNMPRMDGFELIEAIRAAPELRGVPILVLSTEFSEEKKSRARSAGATGWITKPFDAAKLGAAIRRVAA